MRLRDRHVAHQFPPLRCLTNLGPCTSRRKATRTGSSRRPARGAVQRVNDVAPHLLKSSGSTSQPVCSSSVTLLIPHKWSVANAGGRTVTRPVPTRQGYAIPPCRPGLSGLLQHVMCQSTSLDSSSGVPSTVDPHNADPPELGRPCCCHRAARSSDHRPSVESFGFGHSLKAYRSTRSGG